MSKYFGRLRVCTIVGVAAAAFGMARADFPKDLLDKHPCLKQVQSPWYDPIKAGGVPTSLQDWDTVYVGYWNEPDGSKVCSAFLLTSVNADGNKVAAIYTNAIPYKREHVMSGRFLMMDGKKALKIEKSDWWVQYVMNDDGSLDMTISPSSKHAYPVSSQASRVWRIRPSSEAVSGGRERNPVQLPRSASAFPRAAGRALLYGS